MEANDSNAGNDAGALLDDPIDFDRAEYADDAPPALECTRCSRDIEHEYFQVGGSVACAPCGRRVRDGVEAAYSRKTFLLALRNGLLAAAVGSVTWYWITKLTHMELGIVAIAIGILIGWTIRKTTGGHGGKRYQALAMFLTYSAVVWTYIPQILDAAEQGANRDHAAVVAAGSSTAPLPAAASSDPAAPRLTPAPAAPPRDARPPFNPGRFLLACLMLVGLAYAVPFLAGAANLLGIIIIGIGVHQAWKMTRRVPLAIEGPFHRGAGAREREAPEPAERD